jgi:hypothetical protein
MRKNDPLIPHGDVELIKLDHHGSTKENLGEAPEKTAQDADNTAVESSSRGKKKSDGADLTAKDITETVFEKMKPKGLLVTPGNRHGHPSELYCCYRSVMRSFANRVAAWDVLLVLNNYLTKQEGALGLFTTRSFYWLDTNEPPGIKKLNFNHNSVLFMQELYKLVCKTYNDDDDDDPDVFLNDLIVLDQQERVKLQAEYERHKKAYGRRLQKDVRPSHRHTGGIESLTPNTTGQQKYREKGQNRLEGGSRHDRRRVRQGAQSGGGTSSGQNTHVHRDSLLTLVPWEEHRHCIRQVLDHQKPHQHHRRALLVVVSLDRGRICCPARRRRALQEDLLAAHRQRR